MLLLASSTHRIEAHTTPAAGSVGTSCQLKRMAETWSAAPPGCCYCRLLSWCRSPTPLLLHPTSTAPERQDSCHLFMVCVGLLWLYTTPGVQQGMWPHRRPSSLALGLATPGLPCIAFCPGVRLSPSWGWNAALLATPAEMVYVALTACLGVGACACVGCCVPCLHVWCGVSASPEVHSAGSGRFPVANPM
jgi:hypothetical protein